MLVFYNCKDSKTSSLFFLIFLSLSFIIFTKKHMFKVIPFIIALLLAEKKENYDKLEGIYTLDNPSERVVWEKIRLADPSTGVIPKNIRKKN